MQISIPHSLLSSLFVTSFSHSSHKPHLSSLIAISLSCSSIMHSEEQAAHNCSVCGLSVYFLCILSPLVLQLFTLISRSPQGIYDQRHFRECLNLVKRHYAPVPNSQMLLAQQLQPQSRQVVVDHSSEVSRQLQPNNPHRDSGDHNMSDATQTDSSVLFSQQR